MRIQHAAGEFRTFWCRPQVPSSTTAVLGLLLPSLRYTEGTGRAVARSAARARETSETSFFADPSQPERTGTRQHQTPLTDKKNRYRSRSDDISWHSSEMADPADTP